MIVRYAVGDTIRAQDMVAGQVFLVHLTGPNRNDHVLAKFIGMVRDNGEERIITDPVMVSKLQSNEFYRFQIMERVDNRVIDITRRKGTRRLEWGAYLVNFKGVHDLAMED